jgi:hypothetical protein
MKASLLSLFVLASVEGANLRQQFFQTFNNLVHPENYHSSADYHKLLKCKFDNGSQLENFQSYDIWRTVPGEYFIVRVKDSMEFSKLSRYFECDILVEDIETHFNLTQQLQPEEDLTVYDFEAQDEELFDKNRFFKKYHSYSTYLKLLHHWSKKYPKYVEYEHTIGKSVEGRDIVAFRVSNFRARNLKQKIW